MIPTLPIEVACPTCGQKYSAQVQSIIDMKENPELKSALLAGRMNAVSCPKCGAVGALSTPLLYHDADKELLLIYVPPELNLPMTEREKLTGSLVNALMSALPAGARRGYFLNPRQMLTRESLVEEILKADGITREMLEEQRARARLLEQLLASNDDEVELSRLITENKERIDYSFFLTLAAAAEESEAFGQEDVAKRLLALRDRLLEEVPVALPEPLPLDTPVADVVEKALATTDEEAQWAFVLYNRPLLDYAFFQELTRRIDQADEEAARPLRELRSRLLDLTESLDKQARQVQASKLKLLEEIVGSENPTETLKQHRQHIDLTFMSILSAAIRQAREAGDESRVQRLLSINDAVMDLLQEGLPPQFRLVNELLAAPGPDEAAQLLEARRSEWDADLLDVLDTLAEDLQERGREETSVRIQQLRRRAEELLQRDSEGPE